MSAGRRDVHDSASGRHTPTQLLGKKERRACIQCEVGIELRGRGLPERGPKQAGRVVYQRRNRVPGVVAEQLVRARDQCRDARGGCTDEPTGSLDTELRDEIEELIYSMPAATGCSLVVVTHDPAVAERADEVMFLDGHLTTHHVAPAR